MRSSLSRFSTAGVHLLAVSLLPVLVAPVSGEAQLALNWTINSSNHDGFVIERREASTGSFARVAIIAPTQSSYVDATVSDGKTYCYRVRAFNEAGYSRSTNEACASTTQTMALAVVRSGTGSGSVSSSPTGIQCGSDCLTRYPVGTSVRLTATAALGSTFAGWSGDGDCSDGAVTMNIAKTCTAIFNTAVAPTVTISATDPWATEAGPTAATFSLTRTGSTTSSLIVNYTVTGSAVSGIDYVALPRQVTIPAGASTASIHVTPINDTRMEANQTVIVTLASSAAYTIGSPRSATVTIVSNETVTISAIDATATESGLTTGVFRVRRTGSTTASLTVYYLVTGTATRGSDYRTLPGSVTIPAGVSTVDIRVTPINDTSMEANQTVIVTLAPSARYTIGSPRSATVTIVSNE